MSRNAFTHSGNILLVGFAGMIVMMSVLVYMSMRQDIHMVSKDYYEQELVYQQKLDAMNRTDPYDKEFTITEKANVITLRVPEQLSRGMSKGSVYFYCPANEKMDRQKPLVANADGLYTFSKSELLGTGYIAKISLNINNEKYYKELKLK